MVYATNAEVNQDETQTLHHANNFPELYKKGKLKDGKRNEKK